MHPEHTDTGAIFLNLFTVIYPGTLCQQFQAVKSRQSKQCDQVDLVLELFQDRAGGDSRVACPALSIGKTSTNA